MGQTCGCADKGDQEQEVRSDPVSQPQNFQMSAEQSLKVKALAFQREND